MYLISDCVITVLTTNRGNEAGILHKKHDDRNERKGHPILVIFWSLSIRLPICH